MQDSMQETDPRSLSDQQLEDILHGPARTNSEEDLSVSEELVDVLGTKGVLQRDSALHITACALDRANPTCTRRLALKLLVAYMDAGEYLRVQPIPVVDLMRLTNAKILLGVSLQLHDTDPALLVNAIQIVRCFARVPSLLCLLFEYGYVKTAAALVCKPPLAMWIEAATPGTMSDNYEGEMATTYQQLLIAITSLKLLTTQINLNCNDPASAERHAAYAKRTAKHLVKTGVVLHLAKLLHTLRASEHEHTTLLRHLQGFFLNAESIGCCILTHFVWLVQQHGDVVLETFRSLPEYLLEDVLCYAEVGPYFDASAALVAVNVVRALLWQHIIGLEDLRRTGALPALCRLTRPSELPPTPLNDANCPHNAVLTMYTVAAECGKGVNWEQDQDLQAVLQALVRVIRDYHPATDVDRGTSVSTFHLAMQSFHVLMESGAVSPSFVATSLWRPLGSEFTHMAQSARAATHEPIGCAPDTPQQALCYKLLDALHGLLVEGRWVPRDVGFRTARKPYAVALLRDCPWLPGFLQVMKRVKLKGHMDAWRSARVLARLLPDIAAGSRSRK